VLDESTWFHRTTQPEQFRLLGKYKKGWSARRFDARADDEPIMWARRLRTPDCDAAIRA
jgi:hypothetical protein